MGFVRGRLSRTSDADGPRPFFVTGRYAAPRAFPLRTFGSLLYKTAVQFEFPFRLRRQARALTAREQWLRVGARHVRLWLVANPQARRYVLRLRPDGSVRLTVPRRGTAVEAIRFAESNVHWLERQLARQTINADRAWRAGNTILVQGEHTRIEPAAAGESGVVRLGEHVLAVKDPAADLRPELERHLWRMAARELPMRVHQLAGQHQLAVRRVMVRNQRSRWGSCSHRGTISLNWRLVQAPVFVRDYIILHELAHLREMNHSRRFWREVEALCPEFRAAERWLKSNAELLR